MKYEFTIECVDVAPLKTLSETFTAPSMRLAILANNGSGKTFLSRMFALLDKTRLSSIPPLTDDYISFGQEEGKFVFQLKSIDKAQVSTLLEDIVISIKRGEQPTLPTPKFIYHCFNEDYVEANVAALDFGLSGEIREVVLGRLNIGLGNERNELVHKLGELDREKAALENSILVRTNALLVGIPRISAINEYRNLTVAGVRAAIGNVVQPSLSHEELRGQYDSVASITDDLKDIPPLDAGSIDLKFIDDLAKILETTFTLENFENRFREKVLNKQKFVESGLELLGAGEVCPFCEQSLIETSLKLIDEYRRFVNDEESLVRSKLRDYQARLGTLKAWARGVRLESENRNNRYRQYTRDYVRELKEEPFDAISGADLDPLLKSLDEAIAEKIRLLPLVPLGFQETIEDIRQSVITVQGVIDDLNKKIATVNTIKNDKKNRQRELKRMLCDSARQILAKENRNKFEEIGSISDRIRELERSIQIKEQEFKAGKMKQLAKTIQILLKKFFGEKYQLSEEDFLLRFHNHPLTPSQARKVLSTGEKSVLAFLYFLAEAHFKANDASDYENLFFVIDDPISSMDFHHVYNVAGTLKKLSNLFDFTSARFILLTHNMEFLRILGSTKVVDKSMILHGMTLSEGSSILSVPYVHHLLDVFAVTQGKPTSHTTANSIRHIIETLKNFNVIDTSGDALPKYIDDYFSTNTKVHTVLHALINEQSHGSWRTEDESILPDDYIEVCKSVIEHIRQKHEGQINYCAKFYNIPA